MVYETSTKPYNHHHTLNTTSEQTNTELVHTNEQKMFCYYSLFTLSMPGSQNRKYYIIGTHVYYILFVYHVNAISTSCSCVICHHCLLSFRLRFYRLLWTLSLVFSTVTYSTTAILHSCTTMLRERRVKSGEKEIIL